MLDLIADFFTRLADRGAGPLPGDLTATLRFDVTEAGSVRHWRVAIDHGRVEVTDSGADADCVLTGEAAVFEELVTGHRNPMAAVLRGQVGIAGDVDLLVQVQRLFPAPGAVPRTQTPVAAQMAGGAQ